MKRYLILGCLCSLLLITIVPGFTANEPVAIPKTIGQTFEGEQLFYDVSFLVIPNAAWGKFTFEKNQNGPGYIITLEARTRHILRLLTLMRKDLYRSYVEEIDGGKRLRSYRFEKETTYFGKTRRTITFADYTTHKLITKSWKYGKLYKDESIEYPNHKIFDDPLVAFYNLRYGVYGKIDFDKNITIDSIPINNKMSTIAIDIASGQVTEKERKKLVKQTHRDLLLYVQLGKEVFDTKKGKIQIWLSKEHENGHGRMRPMYVLVEDVTLLGDVSGVLNEKKD
ncbi:MAG: DUF3108 domain-containing protein [bacterium]